MKWKTKTKNKNQFTTKVLHDHTKRWPMPGRVMGLTRPHLKVADAHFQQLVATRGTTGARGRHLLVLPLGQSNPRHLIAPLAGRRSVYCSKWYGKWEVANCSPIALVPRDYILGLERIGRLDTTPNRNPNLLLHDKQHSLKLGPSF